MLHHYTIRKGSYLLRPVRLEDAAFIVELRTHPERNRFINTTSPEVPEQEAWLRQYFERRNDFYFVIEHLRSGKPEGTLAIYNVSEEGHSAEWGRWIVRPGSKAAVHGACMLFDLAFTQLGLDSLHSFVAAGHNGVIRILCILGMHREDRLPDYLCIGGIVHDAVRLRMTRADWEAGN